MAAVSGPPRDARAEAGARLGETHLALVLEPSPPAVGEPWFADDPVDPGPLGDGSDRPVVSPVDGRGDTTWAALSAGDDDLAAWCADRALAVRRPLPDLPPSWVDTRLALHAVAEHVVTPARHAANGKIGLRFTYRGFGTPFFWAGGDTRQVRVEGTDLVVQDGGGSHRHPLTALAAAAHAAGVELGAPTEVFTPTTLAEPDRTLAVDPVAAAVLGAWFGLAASALEQLRADHRADPPARVQLWPEHFDLATDLGAETDATRCTFGASPGDAAEPEPYLYVLPWAEVERGGFWNASSFTGALLPYRDLAGVDQPRAAVLTFFRQGLEQLGGRDHG